MSNCLFCKIVDGSIPSKKAYEDDDILAFHDINPQAPVHILVIPKTHKATLLELEEADKTLVGKIHLVINQLAREKKVAEDGFRVVVNCGRKAGQEVFHIHFHLLGGRSMHWPPG